MADARPRAYVGPEYLVSAERERQSLGSDAARGVEQPGSWGHLEGEEEPADDLAMPQGGFPPVLEQQVVVVREIVVEVLDR
jgi:hypothetical protein